MTKAAMAESLRCRIIQAMRNANKRAEAGDISGNQYSAGQLTALVFTTRELGHKTDFSITIDTGYTKVESVTFGAEVIRA